MNIKLPTNMSYEKICKYFIQCGLSKIVYEAENPGNLIKDLRFEKKIYKPNVKSLYILHKLILLNKTGKRDCSLQLYGIAVLYLWLQDRNVNF